MAAGVQIGSPGQHQRVEAIEQPVGILGRPAVGRQHRHHPACAMNRAGVRERKQHGRLVFPNAEIGVFDRGADSDQRSRHERNLATPPL